MAEPPGAVSVVASAMNGASGLTVQALAQALGYESGATEALDRMRKARWRA
jgi:antitoxin component HigA of HigAB toxin-antitoxin module